MATTNSYTTPVFTFSASTTFTVKRENSISVWLEDEAPQSDIQNPVIRMHLQHLSSYDDPADGTLTERFFAANIAQRYQAETIETFDAPVGGKTGVVQLAQTQTEFHGKPLGVRYYFAMVQLNEESVVEMLCDVLTVGWDTYRPQFEAAGNCFRVGDYEFEQVADQTQWCIAKLTRQFHCDIVARTPQAEIVVEAGKIISEPYAGYLFYVIHKSDLAKQDFSNVVYTLYSS